MIYIVNLHGMVTDMSPVKYGDIILYWLKCLICAGVWIIS